MCPFVSNRISRHCGTRVPENSNYLAAQLPMSDRCATQHDALHRDRKESNGDTVMHAHTHAFYTHAHIHASRPRGREDSHTCMTKAVHPPRPPRPKPHPRGGGGVKVSAKSRLGAGAGVRRIRQEGSSAEPSSLLPKPKGRFTS